MEKSALQSSSPSFFTYVNPECGRQMGRGGPGFSRSFLRIIRPLRSSRIALSATPTEYPPPSFSLSRPLFLHPSLQDGERGEGNCSSGGFPLLRPVASKREKESSLPNAISPARPLTAVRSPPGKSGGDAVLNGMGRTEKEGSCQSPD